MKKEMGGRLARTRAALDALDDEQRLLMEGHRPGAYLRLSFSGACALLCSLGCALPALWTCGSMGILNSGAECMGQHESAWYLHTGDVMQRGWRLQATYACSMPLRQ